jgi:small GTP-binding protein
MNDLYDYVFKIILIGDWGVGKSNIILRLSRDAFDPESRTTIGVEFSQRVSRIKDKKIIIQIWDTAGQDRYKAITSAYYRSAVGAILVYDISKRSSFANLNKWVKELTDNTSLSTVVMVLANKLDLESSRVVSTQEGKDFANSKGYLFQEVSALTSMNISTAFDLFVEKVYDSISSIQDNKRSVSKLSFIDEHENVGYFSSLRNKFCC